MAAMEEKPSLPTSEELLKSLDCAICLETVETPKRLDCNHYFCKHCLDQLLKFNRDGSCTIECPKKCATITNIAKDKTTNDLATDYMINGILDTIAQHQKSSSPKQCGGQECCRSQDGFCRSRAKYCFVCRGFYCSSCKCIHDNSFIFGIMYDRDDCLRVRLSGPLKILLLIGNCAVLVFTSWRILGEGTV